MLEVPIIVEDPELLAGAAFTLQYSDALNVNIDSSFFDTFYNQFDSLENTGSPEEEGSGWKFPLLDENNDPVLDENENPVLDENENPVYLPDHVVVGDRTYWQPLLDNPVTDDSMVRHHIAAARCQPAAAGGDPGIAR